MIGLRLLALAGALVLAACGAPAREWPAPAPALWEVTGEHGEHGWLFGTIHALPDGVAWRTPTFERAFAQADVLLVEIGNLGDTGEAQRVFAAYSRGAPQPPLSTRVPAADRDALVALMAKAGMSDGDFWNVETWGAALILADAARESDSDNGVDRALLDAGKPTEGLETFASQFAHFDHLAEAQQRALLAGIAHEAGGGQANAEIEAWLTGDLAVLETQAERGFLRDPVLREALLTSRNQQFDAGIALALEQGRKPFVAVGAGHMLGEDGLPALLAARGYSVRRIQ
jgi:uncharacterized protein YbaP (TraB family)